MQEVHAERASHLFGCRFAAKTDVPPSPQPLEIYVDDEKKLTLHGLQQHFVRLEEQAKNRKLNDLLDTLEFNQVSPQERCVNGGLRRSDAPYRPA